MCIPKGDLHSRPEVLSVQLFGPRVRTEVLVSIVIPTYRRHDLLQEAVLSALGQERFEDYEIIIIDNDPDGEVPSWINDVSGKYPSRRFYYFKNEKNLGMTGNWNRGIELSQGKWISFLHDDDWLAPDFLKQMMSSIPENAKAIACRTERGVLPYASTHVFATCVHLGHIVEVSPCRIAAGNLVDAPGALYRKSELIKLGGYSELFYPSSDYHLNARLVLSGGVYLLFEKLAYYRTSDSLTFKGGTLEAIMSQSQKIRRFILEKNCKLTTRMTYLASSLWWYRLGISKGFNVSNVFGSDPVLNFFSRIPGSLYFFRLTSRIMLTWR